jgi:hypothetical protein
MVFPLHISRLSLLSVIAFGKPLTQFALRGLSGPDHALGNETACSGQY